MAESVHTQFLEEAQARIRALKLPGLDSDMVQVREAPFNDKNLFEGVSLFQANENYSAPFGQPVNAEDIGYHCGVSMVRKRSGASRGHVDRPMEWRIPIRREFLQKRMTTPAPVGEVNIISTVHKWAGPALPKGGEFKDPSHLLVEFLLVIFWTRALRNSA